MAGKIFTTLTALAVLAVGCWYAGGGDLYAVLTNH